MTREKQPTPEPFPLLNTADQLAPENNEPRRRRKSSGLGGEIRAGDTGVPSLASSRHSLSATDRPSLNGVANGKNHTKAGKRRRARGLLSRAKHIIVKHTWVLPAVMLVVMLTAYAINPSESNIMHRFIFLSYPLPQDDPALPMHYGKGRWDVAFVLFYIVVLSFTREFIMQEMLLPLAKKTGLSRAKQARFMEQAYTAIYFAFLGPAGLYVMSKTPVWYFNTTGMYENFPHKTHEAEVKFYYLFQAAYWAQQAIVLILGLEKPRKDYYELVGHHIVSLALIGLSYRFHFTYIGVAVYISHDISDFFLATSKVLNYLDHWLIGPYFFVFLCVWVYLRHYINIRILISLFTEFRTVGPFELDWAAEQYKCTLSQFITAGLLMSLQALNLFWLFYIVRIAVRFLISPEQATDDRSDDEEEEEIEVPTVAINGKAEKTD
ncbi:hypothetical protein VHEMI01674 [[Torrubiella] hemipterigena]|uniref:TLC domain-containing protein n=1 Tax=[Torrubiella] hemipterigena TaxID=1531966 RepID=A0A0A1SMI7_9HYPO|nr:hypothetical protein VHEMI01674 [[Torrubiella] hemipterigena]